MPITEFSVHNYKSLREISIPLRPFMVFVGANAAGKSNFVDALHFTSEVYRLGLEVAIARKGGYENICFRRARRSKAPIMFAIQARVPRPLLLPSGSGTLLVRHKFQIQATGEAISADFIINDETLTVDYRRPTRGARTHPGQLRLVTTDVSPDLPAQIRLMNVRRKGSQAFVETPGIPMLRSVLGKETSDDNSVGRMLRFLERLTTLGSTTELDATELSVGQVSRLFPPLRSFPLMVSKIRVYQLSPGVCREPGVPTPNPELDRFGENLPAMVDFLRKHHPRSYEDVRKYLREIIPSLEDVEAVYTHRKTLTLSFRERGIRRSWPIEDVSDGTVQALAILTAMFDPRIDLIAVEEPENSVHPWIVRSLVRAAREASNQKQIILTTHSPVLIEALVPDELRVVYKRNGETTVRPVLSLDEGMKTMWESGEVSLFDYLDSGAIPEAVPGEPWEHDGSEEGVS